MIFLSRKMQAIGKRERRKDNRLLMENRKENEMEQIQRGLEEFLEKELNHMGKADPHQPQGRRKPEDTYIQKDGYGEDDFQTQRGSSRSGEYDQREGHARGGGYDQREGYARGGGYDQREGYARGGGYDQREDHTSRGYGQYDGSSEEYARREGNGGSYAYGQEETFYGDPQEYEPQYQDNPGYSPEDAEVDSSVYDWDSEAPRSRRKNNGQETMHTRRQYDSGEGAYQEGSRSRNREQSPVGKASNKSAGSSEKKSQGRTAQEEESQMAKKSSKSKQPPKKKRKKKHRLLKFLIVIAVIFVLLGVGLYKLVGVVYGKMTYHEIASLVQAPMKEDGVVNVLLIGNDSRENGEDGRSDAMILLSISNKTKKIYMTSLLRDMYVEIPGHDWNRLNAAYSFGGAELLMETIEENLDISVNRYVLVNFEAFAGLVDAVGGIELELTTEEIEYVNGYLVEYNMLTDRPQGTDNMDPSAGADGPVHLNGPQALAYSRNRYLGTDFGRTDRQRKVLTAVIGKLPSALLTNPGGLIDGLLPNLTTNLTQKECFSLSLMAGKLFTYDIESDSIPQPGTYQDVTIRKMQVLEVDFDTNIRYLKEKLYGE